MPYLMKRFFTILTVLFFIACSERTAEETENEEFSNSSITEFIIGERIDGPANIRDTVNGRILFTLNDNVLVETSIAQGKWTIVGLNVKLTEQQFENFKIYPNTDLISSDGQKIGITKDTVYIWMTEENSGLVGAYTHIDNIKKQSMPEFHLEQILEKEKFTFSSLQSFIKNFKFQKYDLNKLPNLTQYLIYESIIEDMSPRDRITLLFNQSQNLVGIIHSRPLLTGKFKTYKLIRGHSLTVTAELTKTEINDLIKKRIEFYNSVD